MTQEATRQSLVDELERKCAELQEECLKHRAFRQEVSRQCDMLHCRLDAVADVHEQQLPAAPRKRNARLGDCILIGALLGFSSGILVTKLVTIMVLAW